MEVDVVDKVAIVDTKVELTLSLPEFATLLAVHHAFIGGNNKIRDGLFAGLQETLDLLSNEERALALSVQDRHFNRTRFSERNDDGSTKYASEIAVEVYGL